MEKLIDFSEPILRLVLPILLKDQTTGKNIIWATDPPPKVDCGPMGEITIEQLDRIRLTLDKDTIKRYAAAHEEHDAWMCFWFLAAPIKSINKLRRADLEASTSKRNAAKHSIELAIGDLTSYLDWLVERFGIPTEEILEIKSYKVQRTRDRIAQEATNGKT